MDEFGRTHEGWYRPQGMFANAIAVDDTITGLIVDAQCEVVSNSPYRLDGRGVGAHTRGGHWR